MKETWLSEASYFLPGRPVVAQPVKNPSQAGYVKPSIEIPSRYAKARHACPGQLGTGRPVARLRVKQISALRHIALGIEAAQGDQLLIPVTRGQRPAPEWRRRQLLPALLRICEV